MCVFISYVYIRSGSSSSASSPCQLPPSPFLLLLLYLIFSCPPPLFCSLSPHFPFSPPHPFLPLLTIAPSSSPPFPSHPLLHVSVPLKGGGTASDRQREAEEVEFFSGNWSCKIQETHTHTHSSYRSSVIKELKIQEVIGTRCDL